MLQKLAEVLNAKAYADRSIRNYVQEMRLLFAYYNDVDPKDLVQDDFIAYINFIKKVHGVGRDKCRLFAASCSFFYKFIYRSKVVFPTPRKPLIPSNFSSDFKYENKYLVQELLTWFNKLF